MQQRNRLKPTVVLLFCHFCVSESTLLSTDGGMLKCKHMFLQPEKDVPCHVLGSSWRCMENSLKRRCCELSSWKHAHVITYRSDMYTCAVFAKENTYRGRYMVLTTLSRFFVHTVGTQLSKTGRSNATSCTEQAYM